MVVRVMEVEATAVVGRVMVEVVMVVAATAVEPGFAAVPKCSIHRHRCLL